jgi:hypothetical protein
MSCTKYGTTKPMTKPRIKSISAVFMATMPNHQRIGMTLRCAPVISILWWLGHGFMFLMILLIPTRE